MPIEVAEKMEGAISEEGNMSGREEKPQGTATTVAGTSDNAFKIGGTAVGGVAIGSALGSIVSPAGAAVGAVVGGIVGAAISAAEVRKQINE
jgi:outer membrane lipoprotein SlyB